MIHEHNFHAKIGTKVAITKDKNNKDCKINWGNNSPGIKYPTKMDLEKSGLGKKSSPAINPNNIDTYAFFSLIDLV